MVEMENRKLNGLMKQEKNQLQGVLEEKMRELRDKEVVVKERDQTIKDNSDMMELLRNQIQQYSRDYEEERVSREKFALQFKRLEELLKEKEKEIDMLQDQLAKNAASHLKGGPDVCCVYVLFSSVCLIVLCNSCI